jgi:hypothetical protein
VAVSGHDATHINDELAHHIRGRKRFDSSPPNSLTQLIKLRISPHPVKEGSCAGQEVDKKPRTEEIASLRPSDR